MGNDDKAHIFGHLSRQVRDLDANLDYLRIELRRIGMNLREIGELLNHPNGPITLDRESMDFASVFGVIERYNETLAERDNKKVELEGMK
jgi:hypothetical protein